MPETWAPAKESSPPRETHEKNQGSEQIAEKGDTLLSKEHESTETKVNWADFAFDEVDEQKSENEHSSEDAKITEDEQNADNKFPGREWSISSEPRLINPIPASLPSARFWPSKV